MARRQARYYITDIAGSTGNCAVDDKFPMVYDNSKKSNLIYVEEFRNMARKRTPVRTRRLSKLEFDARNGDFLAAVTLAVKRAVA